MHYRCLKTQTLSVGSYSIEPLAETHLLPIMHWRNAQLDILRQRHPLTEPQQRSYWDRVIAPSFAEPRPQQILFGYRFQDELIGYGGLVHVAWDDKRAEVSFLVAPERAQIEETYREDFGNWLRLMQRVAFEGLGFHRLFTETYDIRPVHISVLGASGFLLEGRMRGHVQIHGRAVDSLLHGCVNPKEE